MKKLVFVGALIIAFFVLVSCNQKPPDENADTTNIISQFTTNAISTTYGSYVTSNELKELLTKSFTFDEMKDKYSLNIREKTDSSLYAQSNTIENVEFFFCNYMDKSKEFKLAYINAPASMVFPEYVNMLFSQIPLVVEEGVDIRTYYRIYDDLYIYAVSTSADGYLHGTDMVSIEKRLN